MRLATALVVSTLALVLSVATASAAAADDECDFTGWQSDCSVSNSGSQIDIGASIDQPGGSAPEGSVPDEPQVPLLLPPYDCTKQSCVVDIIVPPDLTASDLASFRPASPSLTGQPTGFGLVGAPTNVVAAASEQYLSGPLLSWNVTVRFIPVAYVFEYGDGSTRRSTTGGTSWESLGQPQFSPTATSHVYRERGIYPVSVSVQYSASVDFGSGLWRPVAGYVTATSSGYDVQVVEARTALVDRTCVENPSGPGC